MWCVLCGAVSVCVCVILLVFWCSFCCQLYNECSLFWYWLFCSIFCCPVVALYGEADAISGTSSNVQARVLVFKKCWESSEGAAFCSCSGVAHLGLTKIFPFGVCQVSLCVLVGAQRPEGLAFSLGFTDQLAFSSHDPFPIFTSERIWATNVVNVLCIFYPCLVLYRMSRQWLWKSGSASDLVSFCQHCSLCWRVRTSWGRMFLQFSFYFPFEPVPCCSTVCILHGSHIPQCDSLKSLFCLWAGICHRPLLATFANQLATKWKCICQ